MGSAGPSRRGRGPAAAALAVAALLVLLVGLPATIWFDLRAVTDEALRRQVDQATTIIQNYQSFYAQNIAGPLSSQNRVPVIHNFRQVPGAIPIPATLAIEVGIQISDGNKNLQYRFISDYPFRVGRPALDSFEKSALASLRRDPAQPVFELDGSLLDRRVRIAKPVLMGEACVRCHNSHPESPKKDWKVGEVRGIHEVIFRQPIGGSLLAFANILVGLGLAALLVLGLAIVRRR
jgi:hypothetical protein